MKRVLQFASLSCLFLLVGFVRIDGQTATATLQGNVEDQNSAVLAGANVTIQNKATSFERVVVTGANGSFTVPLLPPGTYSLVVRRDGFTAVEVPDIVLNVGDQKTINISLNVGDVNAAIEVRPDETLVDTQASVSTVVDRNFVANIPLNGRSFQSLITLTPGVVLVPSGGAVAQGMFVINGQRSNANIFQVDGVSANAMNSGGLASPGRASSGSLPALSADGGTNSLVSIDALQEFSIQTSTYAAEFGRSPGGQISFVTRSGENQFHGSAFEYFRDDMFDANNWFSNKFGLERSPLKQHDFGGTLSGPVFLPKFGDGGPGWYKGRSKTFFFLSYEGLRLTSPKFAQSWVPSLELRQSAAPSVQPIVNAFPIPNGPEAGDGILAQFNTSYSDSSSLDATSIRIDHALNDKLSFFGRVNKAPSSAITRDTSALAYNYDRPQDLLTVTTGVTFANSSKFVNDLRFNYTSSNGAQSSTPDGFGGAVPLERSVIVPAQFDSSAAQGLVQIMSPSGLSNTYSFSSSQSDQTQINVVNGTTVTVGEHQLKFGVDYRRLTPDHRPVEFGVIPFLLSREDFLTGSASFVVFTSQAPARPIYSNFSAFAQDTWRVSKRLMLSYGLRWELNPSPGEANGDYPLALTQIDDLSTTEIAPLGTPLWKTTYNNFAPRFGASYMLSEKSGRETVVRGGFGVFYDLGTSLGSIGFETFPFLGFDFSIATPFPLDPAIVAPPPRPSLTTPYPWFFGFDPKLTLPYTLQWNIAIEQSLGKNQTVSASYVGAAGRRLLRQRALDITTINTDFTNLNLFDNSATSDYNSLQLQFQRRLSRGLQVLASYTWAHSIDEVSSDDGDFILLRGNSDFDLRHNFTSAITYDIPIPKTNRFGNAVFRGWSIDTRINAQSAFPLNITAGATFDPIDGASKSVRANLIPGVPLYLYDGQYPGGRVLNNSPYTIADNAMIVAAGCQPLTFNPNNPVATNAKGAFCTPVAGESGNLGRNVVRGLASWQIDIALRRQIKVTERLSIQLRAEAFNVLNHPNFGSINRSLGSPNFGQATNMLNQQLGGLNQIYQTGGPRSLQFAAKVIF